MSVKLTRFSHGGGCGCKMSPAVLAEILAKTPLPALPAGAEEWQQKLLTDPQTSGGLLVACAPEFTDLVLAEFEREGFAPAVIGLMVNRVDEPAGSPRLRVS